MEAFPPCVPPKRTQASLIKLAPAGEWGVLRKDRGSRERQRKLFSREIAHSFVKLSVLWFESANSVPAKACIFLPSLPPGLHWVLFSILGLSSSLRFLSWTSQLPGPEGCLLSSPSLASSVALIWYLLCLPTVVRFGWSLSRLPDADVHLATSSLLTCQQHLTVPCRG